MKFKLICIGIFLGNWKLNRNYFVSDNGLGLTVGIHTSVLKYSLRHERRSAHHLQNKTTMMTNNDTAQNKATI